ncbi:MAG: type II CAAX prenyl endopeptidase Rce1 family protein [Salinibacter sp.]
MDAQPDGTEPDPSPQPPTLNDRWAPGGGVWLDGPLERRSMRSATFHFVMGLLALGATFILFQVFVSPLLLVVQIGLSDGGMASLEAMGSPEKLLASYTRELIISNSAGQLLGLALPTLLLARLHTTGVSGYLRLRSVDVRLLVLAGVGVLGLQPVVQWLAQLNQELPLPESVRLFEQTQMELIRSVLESGLGVAFNLGMLALVPGLCEEVLFRGYAQRQFERATGPVGGVLLSGLIFGAYHLRPSQLLPLAVLGVYLAYLTWRTGSLWPAVLVHMTHNGLAVLAARYAQSHPTYDLETIEQASMPWYAVLAGFAIVGGVLYVLHPLARQARDST